MTLRSYDPTHVVVYYPNQIQVKSVNRNGDLFTINYRTEGAKYIGTKVKTFLKKLVGGFWVEVQSVTQGIPEKWENSQNVNFTITEDGSYQVTAQIQKADLSSPYLFWKDETGLVFTRP